MCIQLRAEHSREMDRVQRHNDGIWPQVKVAQIATEELGRVQVSVQPGAPGPVDG